MAQYPVTAHDRLASAVEQIAGVETAKSNYPDNPQNRIADALETMAFGAPKGMPAPTPDDGKADYWPTAIDRIADATVALAESGGGGSSDIATKMIEGTVTELVDDKVTKVAPYTMALVDSLTKISFPNCVEIGECAFMGNLSSTFMSSTTSWPVHELSSISLPKVATIKSSAFQNCQELSEIILPDCTSIGSQAFGGCIKVTVLSLPKLASFADSYGISQLANVEKAYLPALEYIPPTMFQYSGGGWGSALWASNMQAIYLSNINRTSGITEDVFSQCYKLTSLYVLTDYVPILPMSNPAASRFLSSTPIIGYTEYTDGAYGSVYVKASLADQFKASPTWSGVSDRIVGLTDEEIEALDF